MNEWFFIVTAVAIISEYKKLNSRQLILSVLAVLAIFMIATSAIDLFFSNIQPNLLFTKELLESIKTLTYELSLGDIWVLIITLSILSVFKYIKEKYERWCF